MNSIKKIAILLAAFNGENRIEAQINSILAQKNVLITIFISLDKSSDQSLDIIKKLCASHSNISLLPYGERFGNAGKNFYRLLSEVNFENFDYISLADQDDYWLPEKIENAIEKLNKTNSNCYSSNVLAVWPKKNKTKLIIKSQPQVKYDYIFEAAGPGCTYVFDKEFSKSLQNFILNNKSQICLAELHDWLIYSYARSREIPWVIDNAAHMHYIQHESNLVGVNSGFHAKLKRIKLILNNHWINQVLIIYNLTKKDNLCFLENLKINKRKAYLDIALNSHKFRRKKVESYILKIFMTLLSIYPPKTNK